MLVPLKVKGNGKSAEYSVLLPEKHRVMSLLVQTGLPPPAEDQ
jgi:hypothetical protein